jgi:alpha 1,3-glucosidase
MMHWATTLCLAVVCLLVATEAVDRSKFRTCQQTSFCRRWRNTNDRGRPYLVGSKTVQEGEGRVNAELHGGPSNVQLSLDIRFYTSGASRVRIEEKAPLNGKRWEPNDIVMEHNLQPAAFRSLAAGDPALPAALATANLDNYLVYAFAGETSKETSVLAVQKSPFNLELFVEGRSAVQANKRGLFHFEHHRKRGDQVMIAHAESDDEHKGKTIVDYGEDGLAMYSDGTRQAKKEAETAQAQGDEDGLWEESFSSHHDTKPFGPASIGMDITFTDADHVYGLPEHTSPLSLKTTTGPGAQYNEPYRMYTLDVFEYELDSPMALYGGIPLMLAHSRQHNTVGAFWNNPTETWIDVSKAPGEGKTETHWISESGVAELFLLPGPTAAKAMAQMNHIVGGTELPPLFALGYHQCRWNYKDEADVAQVHAHFEEHDYPYDVIWLDIEHTDGKRYFTWDKGTFPTPKEMIQNVSDYGRRMVTIVDPHMKRDNNYEVHKKATAKRLYVRDKDGADFDGWCWPGSSSYLDFTNAGARAWWQEQFRFENYVGSTEDLYTWNDMNEPSVFNGPEVSMQKDCKAVDGAEHREWHNLYGMYMQRATAEGQVLRNAPAGSVPVVTLGAGALADDASGFRGMPGTAAAAAGGAVSTGGSYSAAQAALKRPFVLSRAFYAGSQR